MGQCSRLLSLGLFPLLFACAKSAPPKTATDQVPGQEQILPLVRVRLYASGVGYFERRGDVSAGQRRLPVPLGHLDDALKTLVLLSSDSEQLSLSFPSRVSPAVARARAGMAAAENAALSYDRLLAALRGEQVVVTLGSAARLGKSQVSGRVMEVVSVEPSHPSYDHGPPGATTKKKSSEDGESGEETPAAEVARLQLMLLSPEYGVIRFDLSELVSVRPIDPRIVERFEAALSARIATRANPTEWLEMAGGNRALRDLRLGYLAETPIWRTSYRLVVQDRGRAELQAWALVHNDTDETWRNVKLELVDSYPSSFLFPLAAPRYQRRELQTPSDELSSVPQLSTTTPDAMWGDFSDYQGEVVESIAGESSGAGGLGLSGSGGGAGGGYGEGHGVLSGGRSRRAAGLPQTGSDLLWVGDLQKQAGVIPPAERAVSVYEVKAPLDLLPQHSALLPFLKEGVSARTIVWFSSTGAQPERAIAITNSTQNTLPEGPMSVFGRGGFLGEAVLESLQPGGRQFARIGDEADFDLSVAESNTESVRYHVDFLNDQLRVHSITIRKPHLVFNNRSGAPAEIYVGMTLVTNSVLQGSDRLDFDSRGTPFAVFDVPAGPGTERNLMARQGIAESHPADGLDLDQLDELIRDQNLPGEERAILTKARPLLEQRLSTVRAQEELEVELASAKDEVKSLKQTSEDVGAKESKEAGTVMTNRVLGALDNVRKIEAKKRNLEKELATRTQALKTTLAELNAFRAKLLEERKRAAAAK